MKLSRIALATVGTLMLAGAVYALQQGTRFPGERGATTSLLIDADEDDEVILTYNTLQFGPQFAQSMMGADEATREQFAGFVPSRLNAKFSCDVPLMAGETRLDAGSYGLTFLANDNGGLDLRFLGGNESIGQVSLDMSEGGANYEFLSFNLRSAGSDEVILSMDYGSLKGTLTLSVAEEEEEEEEEG